MIRRKWLYTFILLIFSIVVVVFIAQKSRERTDVESAANSYTYLKKDCGFSIPWPATITCGELHTPKRSGENWIFFAILHDDAVEHKPDPVVYLQGGPGVGARIHQEGVTAWLAWMKYANLQRDIILVDTRGTGRSRPALNCDAYAAFNRSLMRENLSLTEELAQGYDVSDQCFAAMNEQGHVINNHTMSTQKNAEDIRALMRLLAYSEWNILGVSYGTRLALEIARQAEGEPSKSPIKSMVLDSIYPAGRGGVQTWPQVLGDAMEHFFNHYGTRKACDTGCSAEELSVRFTKVLQYLKEFPMELTVPRWDGEAPITFLVNDHRFLSASFAAIYNPEDWEKVLAAINAVEQGKSDGLKPLIEPYLNNSFNADFNSLSFMAIDCADNVIGNETDYLEQVARYPLWADYTRDQWRYQICHALHNTPRSLEGLQFSVSTVPSLLLAGQLDPITPVEWAKELHRHMPQSQLVIREKMAHSVLSTDTCLLEHLRDFFNQPTDRFLACEKLE